MIGMPRASTHETLDKLTSQMEALIALHNMEVEKEATESRPWPSLKHWLGKNIIWVIGIVTAAFVGWLQLRDEYREHLRQAAEFQKIDNARYESDTKALAQHKEEAMQDKEDLKQALIETNVTTIEAMEQIRKEMRIVHPRLENSAPEESDELKAAKKQVNNAKAGKELFKDESAGPALDP